jgi:hypothetical protein
VLATAALVLHGACLWVSFVCLTILQTDEGLQLTKRVVVALLLHLNDCNEWTQAEVLGLLLDYQPADDDEVFDIMVGVSAA